MAVYDTTRGPLGGAVHEGLFLGNFFRIFFRSRPTHLAPVPGRHVFRFDSPYPPSRPHVFFRDFLARALCLASRSAVRFVAAAIDAFLARADR